MREPWTRKATDTVASYAAFVASIALGTYFYPEVMAPILTGYALLAIIVSPIGVCMWMAGCDV